MTVLRLLLLPFSWLYALIITLRNEMYDRGLLVSYAPAVPTICVGNLSVGGTGKTPHTAYLIALLQPHYRVAVVSRGYKRKTKGYILANEHSTAITIGDEPMQLKTSYPEVTVAVCENRVAGVRQLLQDCPYIEVILLDDAFQHRPIKAGLNLLLTSYDRLFSNDSPLPAGRLRESGRGKKRAHAVIVTKCPNNIDNQPEIAGELQLAPNQPLYFSQIVYDTLTPLFNGTKMAQLSPRQQLILFTGIAHITHLELYLQEKVERVQTLSYPDHHHFTTADFVQLRRSFEQLTASEKWIIVTEKDAARLRNNPEFPENIKPYVQVLPITVTFGQDNEMFNQMIENYVRENERDC